MTQGPVLVIGHEHEVIGGRGVLVVLPIRIIKGNCLNHNQTFGLKGSMEFLHKCKQIWLSKWGRFFEIDANTAKLVSFDK